MADFLTHTIFSEEVLYRVNDKKLREEIWKRMDLYILGSQGPDIFYYFNFLPWQNSKDITKIGTLIHNYKTGSFLKMGIEYALKAPGEKDKYDLLSYITGYICHFYLDKNIHPYVCYFTENKIYRKDGSKVKVSHQDIETNIDIIYTREKRNEKAYKTKLYLLFNPNNIPLIVLDFYRYALKELFDIYVPDKDIKKSAADMRKGFRLLYDPLRVKGTILKLLKIKPAKPLYTKSEDDTIDWLNRKKRVWHHLDDRDENYTLSVDEIYENALEECSEVINTLSKRIDSREELDDLFPNISYLTNKPC